MKRFNLYFIYLFLLLISVFIVAVSLQAGNNQAVPHQIQSDTTSASPMFIENVGQFAEDARFQLQGSNHTIWLTKDSIWLTILEQEKWNESSLHRLPKSSGILSGQYSDIIGQTVRGTNIRLSFPGSNPDSEISGYSKLSSTVSYFFGDDPEGWHSAVPIWRGVRYSNLYDGLDLELDGDKDNFELRFKCHSSDCLSALKDVQLLVEGADYVEMDESQIYIDSAVSTAILPVSITFSSEHFSFPLRKNHLVGNKGNLLVFDESLGLNLRELITRPTNDSRDNSGDLLYGSFLGGSGYDDGLNVAIDQSGNIFVSALVMSIDFPTSPGAFDPSANSDRDISVSKLSADLSELIFSTYLGGTDIEYSESIAVASTGDVVVVGVTSSTDFPTTLGSYDETYNGGYDDAFVTKLNSNGSSLVYSSFLGGIKGDLAFSLVIDFDGSAIIGGYTDSRDFPTTPGVYSPSMTGDGGGFITKMNTSGSALTYSTFFYGEVSSLAVDSHENLVIFGNADPDHPTTPSAYDPIINEELGDTHVSKLDSSVTDLLYSTYLGGSDWDRAESVDVDATDNVIVAGWTYSADFPTTPGAFDDQYGGNRDSFVAKFDPTLSYLIYSTYLGGGQGAVINDMVSDAEGSAIIVGHLYSDEFYTTPGAIDPTWNDSTDIFIAKLSAGGNYLSYGSYFGTTTEDHGNSLVLDQEGNVIITGGTWSEEFPTTPGSYDTSHNGNFDIIVSKLFLRESCPVPFFSQRDPRWANHPLRSSGDCLDQCPNGNIGECGCTLTSASMVFNHYGADILPSTLSDCLWTASCPFNWSAGLSCANINSGQVNSIHRLDFSWNENWQDLDLELNQNVRPVILGMHRSDNVNLTHWVVVISGQGGNPSDYIIHDPWYLNGANLTLDTLVRDNYIFDSMAVYGGLSTCSSSPEKYRSDDSSYAVPASTSFVPSKPDDKEFSSHPFIEPDRTPIITGTVTPYRRTLLTMTVQLSATSDFGAISEMQIWTDVDPNPSWQPFSKYIWLPWHPEHEIIYVRFRDEYENISGTVVDTTHPINSPPPVQPQFELLLPIMLHDSRN